MRLVVVDCKTCDREIVVFTFTVDVQFVRLDTDFEAAYRCPSCGALHRYMGGDLQLRALHVERAS
jgi:ribosomal protein S27E